MNDRLDVALKAIEYAKSLSETIITIATGIITISITFTKDILNDKNTGFRNYLSWSWLCYFISIVFGIGHIQVLIGIVNQDSNLDFTSPARWAFGIQLILFLAGTLSAIIYGIKTLKHMK